MSQTADEKTFKNAANAINQKDGNTPLGITGQQYKNSPRTFR